MNCIILLPDDFVAPDRVLLGGRRLVHVTAVHRAAVGDTLRVGALNGKLGSGAVTRLDSERLEMSVVLDTAPPPPLPCALVVALPRPKSMRKVLHAATTMGVKKICFVNAHRVDKSYWKSPRMKPDAIREVLLLGLEQSVDTVLPEVSLHRRIRWFVEDELPGLAERRTRLIAHPSARQACPRDLAGPSILAVGPEGGFVDYEVGYFVDAGFTAVSIGPRVLRVEEAVAALLGRLG